MRLSTLVLLVGPAAATAAVLSDDLIIQRSLHPRFVDPNSIHHLHKRGDRQPSAAGPSRSELQTQKTIKYSHTKADEQRNAVPREVHLKMKAQRNSGIRQVIDDDLRSRRSRNPSPQWKNTEIYQDERTITQGPQLLNVKDTQSLSGQMVNKAAYHIEQVRAKSSGKIKGPAVRADVGTTRNGEATIRIKDPSKYHYPSGRHTETISGATSKIFRADSLNPMNPAKIKVKMNGPAAAQFEGNQRHSAEALDTTRGDNRHRLPVYDHGQPALIEDQWAGYR